MRDLLLNGLAARDLDDADRAATVVDLTERVELLAADAQPHDECGKLVGDLSRDADALFTQLIHPDIDATNWRAKQAVRPAVVNRQGSATAPGAARPPRAGP